MKIKGSEFTRIDVQKESLNSRSPTISKQETWKFTPSESKYHQRQRKDILSYQRD